MFKAACELAESVQNVAITQWVDAMSVRITFAVICNVIVIVPVRECIDAKPSVFEIVNHVLRISK